MISVGTAERDDLVGRLDAVCLTVRVRRKAGFVGTADDCNIVCDGGCRAGPWKRAVANPTSDAKRPDDAEDEID